MLEEGTVFASKEAERAQHSLALFIEKLGLFDGDPHIADVQEAASPHITRNAAFWKRIRLCSHRFMRKHSDVLAF